MSNKDDFIFIFGKEEKKYLDQKELESILMLRVMGVKIEKLLIQEGCEEIDEITSLRLIKKYKQEMQDTIKTIKNEDDSLIVKIGRAHV